MSGHHERRNQFLQLDTGFAVYKVENADVMDGLEPEVTYRSAVKPPAQCRHFDTTSLLSGIDSINGKLKLVMDGVESCIASRTCRLLIQFVPRW